jgi:GrpB-like predicted nucleotidyltransferase (UPF0157 family)
MPRSFTLVAYDPAWPARFEAARAAILQACPEVVTRVEHIGSTSVPGLEAKDIIDVMPGLARFEDGERCIAPLAAIGYEYRGEYGIPGRHYWVKDDPATGVRLQNVHMYEVGYDEWTAHLAFRDYLLAHDDWRDRYATLKRDLAARHADDVQAYADAKADFVREAVARHASETGSGHVYRRLRSPV